ncbi:hypothetical protein AB395_00001971 [Sinorhizobium fredii CCBAU 45436]|nr:hypothetical protein AB395_00001971 [Sinorhizobium fredii CCBAU 45436]AWM25473.1 hypothetical protein AOX55_00002221 [Sinorhizobium fredii CCBAU 25509]MQW99428.1 hypothetical protein [Sinorhizobium fredii]UTY49645.1 hypothetical protein EPK84_24230 [Sinorhizobium fredii]
MPVFVEPFRHQQGNMRRILAVLLIAATTASAAAAGQSGKPRYFVKAWLQKADKTFEHTTIWCGPDQHCLVPIGEDMIELRELSGSSYHLRFISASSEDTPCCVFRNGSREARLESEYPRVATLYYRPEILGGRGVTKFGRLIIVVEDLY